MTTLTHTSRGVHVPITWVVLLVVVLAVIALVSTAVSGLDRTSATAGVSLTGVQPAPAPAPGPMAMQPTAGRTLIGQPYQGRAGAYGWLS